MGVELQEKFRMRWWWSCAAKDVAFVGSKSAIMGVMGTSRSIVGWKISRWVKGVVSVV